MNLNEWTNKGQKEFACCMQHCPCTQHFDTQLWHDGNTNFNTNYLKCPATTDSLCLFLSVSMNLFCLFFFENVSSMAELILSVSFLQVSAFYSCFNCIRQVWHMSSLLAFLHKNCYSGNCFLKNYDKNPFKTNVAEVIIKRLGGRGRGWIVNNKLVRQNNGRSM